MFHKMVIQRQIKKNLKSYSNYLNKAKDIIKVEEDIRDKIPIMTIKLFNNMNTSSNLYKQMKITKI